MIRALVSIAALTLAACSAPDPAENAAAAPMSNAATEGAAVQAALANGAMPPLPSAAATPTRTLPAEIVGTWTADPRGDCAPGNPLRIDVTPARIRFHESVADIERVVRTWPEGYGVDAQVTGEGQTEARSFDLIPHADGTLIRSEAPYAPITYTRCKA